MKQHRCHARLADVVHTIMELQPGQTPRRVGLWVKCMRAEAGQEPADPFLVDPAAHKLVARNPHNPFKPLEKKAPAPEPAAAVATATAAAAAPRGATKEEAH